MIKETIYGVIAMFAVYLMYEILVPVWISFKTPFFAVSNTVIGDATYRSALTSLPTNLTTAINYTFVGLMLLLVAYLCIAAIRKEGETYD